VRLWTTPIVDAVLAVAVAGVDSWRSEAFAITEKV
jgi:hypothetical protein